MGLCCSETGPSLVSPSSVCMSVTCHLSFQASSTPSLSWLDSAPGPHPLTHTIYDYLSPGPSFLSVLRASMSPGPGTEQGVGELHCGVHLATHLSL